MKKKKERRSQTNLSFQYFMSDDEMLHKAGKMTYVNNVPLVW